MLRSDLNFPPVAVGFYGVVPVGSLGHFEFRVHFVADRSLFELVLEN